VKRLRKRVKAVGSNHQRAMADYTPVPVAAQASGSAASPPAAGTMPLAQVVVYPEPGGQYSTIGYMGLVPLYTTDGAVVPATGPGRWAQLVTAGRA
jgi:hypothetical protein